MQTEQVILAAREDGAKLAKRTIVIDYPIKMRKKSALSTLFGLDSQA